MLTYEDILFNYKKIKEESDKKIEDEIQEIANDFILWLIKTRPELDDANFSNIELFLFDLPIDIVNDLFVINIDKLNRKSEEFKYMSKLHYHFCRSRNDNTKPYGEKYYIMYNNLIDFSDKLKRNIK